MSDQEVPNDPVQASTPSQEFTAYCEAEFERRLNSGSDFDEAQFRKAMSLVVDKLAAHEAGDKA